MTASKDLKRVVRARMKKTGESYTAARAHVTRKRASKTSPAKVIPGSNYEDLAGMSNEAIKAKTGCTWDAWVGALDYQGAEMMSHRDIAQLVRDKWNVGEWWAQTVTVGYERIKGLRERGQRRDGSYEASKARTFPVPVATLFNAVKNPRTRKRWLDVPGIALRSSTPLKAARLSWNDGTGVVIGFYPKGEGKSSIAIAHQKLATRDRVEEMKSFWSERLDDLAGLLGGR